MKQYNKILEAVQRGINLALDDFDDELVSQLTLTIKDINHTKEYLDLMDLVVDLGLPSGTLWFKKNLGAKDESDYGYLYAWGEIKPSNTNITYEDIKNGNFDYKYLHNGKLTKYCTDSEYGNKDDLILLLPEDDPASLNNHFAKYNCHTPTREQCIELKKYTTTSYVNNGILFTSIINKNTLFIPLVINPNNSDWMFMSLMTSSLHKKTPTHKYCLLCYLISGKIGVVVEDSKGSFRYYKSYIRPVINLN